CRVAPPASSVWAARAHRKPRRSSAWPRAGRRRSPAAMPGSRCHGRCERLRDEGADGLHAVRARRDGVGALMGARVMTTGVPLPRWLAAPAFQLSRKKILMLLLVKQDIECHTGCITA